MTEGFASFGHTARLVLRGLAAALVVAVVVVASGDEVRNPYIGQAEAIEKGDQIYRNRCYGCHGKAGARGPNLFATKLSDKQFLQTVINGRLGARGQMPVLGAMIKTHEVWYVHAFVKSRSSF